MTLGEREGGACHTRPPSFTMAPPTIRPDEKELPLCQLICLLDSPLGEGNQFFRSSEEKKCGTISPLGANQ